MSDCWAWVLRALLVQDNLSQYCLHLPSSTQAWARPPMPEDLALRPVQVLRSVPSSSQGKMLAVCCFLYLLSAQPSSGCWSSASVLGEAGVLATSGRYWGQSDWNSREVSRGVVL